jgi:hypothetical protein
VTRRPLLVYAAAAGTLVLWSGTPIANKIAVATILPGPSNLHIASMHLAQK